MEATESSGDAGRSQSQKPRRHQVATACVRCRKRKIRCNGRFPCETCLRLRLTCQEPEVKRNPSRASLERRIEQLETLASEAGIDLFSRAQQESGGGQQEGTAGGRDRSASSASARSSSSLPLPLRTDAAELVPPANSDYDHPTASDSASATSPLDIPMIEVTASSRTQSPDPFGFHSAAPHTPDLATPALSTGSLSVPQSPALAPPALQPWHFSPHDYDTSMDSSLALEHDPFALSRRSSTSSHTSRTVPNHVMRMGSMPPPDDKDAFLRQGQLSRQPAMPSNHHLTVDSINKQPPTHHEREQLGSLSSTVPSLQIPQAAYGGLDVSPTSATSDSMMTGIPHVPTPAEKHSYAFSEHYAQLFSAAYFQHVHPLFPFLDHDTFYFRDLVAVYNSSNNQPAGFSFSAAGLHVYMVQAIGARILEYLGGLQKTFRDAYFSAAMLCRNPSNKLETLHDIHSALLLLVYSRYCDTPQIEPLTLKATVTSSCVQLGLHKPNANTTTTPFSVQDNCALRTFVSAYILDRAISLSLNEPFSTSDDDLEIEALVAQLERQQHQEHQQQQQTLMPFPPSGGSTSIPLSVLTTAAKIYRIVSTVHAVHSHSRPNNAQGIPRLSTPFLTTPTPTTLATWRSEIFRTLETLTAEFNQRKATQPLPQPQFQEGPKLDDVNDTVELMINGSILFLLHPPPPFSPSLASGTTVRTAGASDVNPNVNLNPFEIRTVQSTARATMAICRRLQGAKSLVPSAHVARVVYLSGVALSSCLHAQNTSTKNKNSGGSGSGGGNKKTGGGRPSEQQGRKSVNTGGAPTPAASGGGGSSATSLSNDPDFALCKGILGWFSDEGVGVAGTYAEKLKDR